LADQYFRNMPKTTNLKQHILDTSISILSLEGYGALTMRALALKTKLSLPILYKYFDNKDSLMLEVVSSTFAELEKKFVFLKNNSSSYLDDIVSEIFDFFVQKPYVFDYIFKNSTFATTIYRKQIQLGIEHVVTNPLGVELIMAIVIGRLTLKKDLDKELIVYLHKISALV
jgi:AcrR family transcriptional regulator